MRKMTFMPNFSKNEIVLVRYPFSDLTNFKIRPAVVVNAPQVSKDLFIVALSIISAIAAFGRFYKAQTARGEWCSLDCQPINLFRLIMTATGKLTLQCSDHQTARGICNNRKKALQHTCLDLEMIFRYRMFMFDNYFSK